MIIEKLKTWIIAIGVFIGAIFIALLTGEWKGKKKQEQTQEAENAQAEVKQMESAQQTFQEAQQAAQQVPTPVVPDVEKRDDLDTTH